MNRGIDAHSLRDLVVGLVGALCVLLLCVSFTKSQSANVGDQNAKNGHISGDVQRGKYLVENVAMCSQCHTPRDDSGNLDRSHDLQGAPVRWVSPVPDPNWPLKAPRIGGNLPASDEDMIRLLTTGIWVTGQPLRFPMMPFRMSSSDAAAVVAYLKTVSPQR
jgi:mono/diheme cytochrome c family protein